MIARQLTAKGFRSPIFVAALVVMAAAAVAAALPDGVPLGGLAEADVRPASSKTLPMSHDIRPGYGITSLGWLSKYHPALRGTPGDTQVYFLDSGKPGATVLIVGGTHADEIAGIMAAILFVERAEVTRGRLIVIPHANNSATTYSEPGGPECIKLITPSGERSFRYGARRTNPKHQAPDAEEFIHYPSGYKLPGEEARNLDRVHPGKADGSLTQQISYGICQLITREKVDVAIDLHEAGPGSRLSYMLVCHPKALEIGAMALLDASAKGIQMQLERSRDDFRGLSHREWGDHTQAYSFLIETPNPGQDPNAKDPDVVNDPIYPLWHRVGVHLLTVRGILDSYSLMTGNSLEWEGMPDYDELASQGLGPFLN